MPPVVFYTPPVVSGVLWLCLLITSSIYQSPLVSTFLRWHLLGLSVSVGLCLPPKPLLVSHCIHWFQFVSRSLVVSVDLKRFLLVSNSRCYFPVVSFGLHRSLLVCVVCMVWCCFSIVSTNLKRSQLVFMGLCWSLAIFSELQCTTVVSAHLQQSLLVSGGLQ